MSEAQDATGLAAFTALSAPGVLGWAIFQHVPENTPPPVNIIGDMSGISLGVKGDDDDEQIEVEFNTVYQGEEKQPVVEEQGRIKTALNGKSFEANGFMISFAFDNSDAVLMPDGETYLGSARYTVFAFKN